MKWSTFHTITRQRPLARPTNDAADIPEAALALLTAEVAPALQSGAAIRLLGVGLHSIVGPRAVPPPSGLIQLRLFEDEPLASAS